MITVMIKKQVRSGILVVRLPCNKVQPVVAEEPVKYLFDKADRYHLIVENYARACNAAENEEYEMPEDINWEH